MRWHRRDKQQQRAAEAKQEQEFVKFLVEAAKAVVQAKSQGASSAALEGLAGQLDDVIGEARRQGAPPLADYFAALQTILRGQDVTAQAARLEEPFRHLVGQVMAALAGGTIEPGADPLALTDEEQTMLTGLVAAANAVVVARAQGDQTLRARLAGRLAEMENALEEDDDVAAADYVAALQAALAGEDVTPLAANLPEPFQSILKELAAALSEVETAQAEAAGPPAGGDAEAEGVFGEL